MGETTGIEWTNSTWNPWHGCHKVSPGCKNCYMYREKARYGQEPNVVVRSKTTFHAPLKWPHEPRLCFTCSWSDFFIEEADAWREEAYAIMRATPWITYQALTKRIERAAGRLPEPMLPNMWLGVSAENQQYADMRIPALVALPVAVRFLSLEPLLGPIDVGRSMPCGYYCDESVGHVDHPFWTPERTSSPLHWVIVGGESGPGARPMDIDWARSIVAQCKAAGVPVFVKQLGSTPGYYGKGWCDLALRDRKGGDMSEWPENLRVREMPRAS